ncbi:MAG: hypothetical protein QW825_02050 [Candidatus Bathyarchaeia archaeon]|nr:hypothetical protein [Candidatus Bathyarchaeota archaeon]
MPVQRKRSKSLSLSENLIRKLNILWYEEMKNRIGRNEKISFSEFVESLIWEALKRRMEKCGGD